MPAAWIIAHLCHRKGPAVSTAIPSPVAAMPRFGSVRELFPFRRGKAAAGDSLPEQGRRHVRDHTATPSVASTSEAFVSPGHLSAIAADLTLPTSQPRRPPLPEPTAPAGAGPAVVVPALFAERRRCLWDRAYDALKQAEPALATAYENILSCQLQNGLGSPVPESQSNDIAQDDPDMRRHQMKQLVDRGRDKMARETKAKERLSAAVDFVSAVRGVVSSAIEAVPQASLAWAGVCVAVQVSYPWDAPFPADASRCLPTLSNRPKRISRASSTWRGG